LGRPDTSTHRSLQTAYVVSETFVQQLGERARQSTKYALELERDEWRRDRLEPLLQQRGQVMRACACGGGK
jgi:hypothetical protein